MSRKKYEIQLRDHVTEELIITTGGKCYVAQEGLAAKQTLYNEDGSSLANPVSITRGKIEFWIDADDNAVDLYGIGPGGHAFQVAGVKPSGPNEINIDTGRKHQVLVIPFEQDDFTANTETDTGFDEPTNAIMLPAPAVRVVDIDAGETIDVGTDSGDSGDANGFIAAASLATAALVKATILNGGNTLGALFEVQDSANAGDLTHEGHVSGGKSITITSSAGADTGSGFIYLPYMLCA